MAGLEGRRRARTQAQKQRRRADILDVAWQLFQDRAYDAITMAHVAEQAGLAKGTPYSYVRTKEELFLAVLARQFDLWFDAIDAEARAGDGPWTPEQGATVLSRSLATRPAFVRLLGMAHPVLEQHASAAAIGAFKAMLVARLAVTGPALEARLPFLVPGQGGQLLLRLYALVIGLQQLAAPPPGIAGTPEAPDLQPLVVAFGDELCATLVALLRGLGQAGTRDG